MLERREGQCACSPRVRGSVGWEGPGEVGQSQTTVGHGEEPDCVLGTMAQEKALEAEQALGCLLNPWECWNAPGPSPGWDLPDRHLKHGDSQAAR